MSTTLEKVLAITLTLSALAMASVVVKREIAPSKTITENRAVFVRDWQQAAMVGREIESSTSAVKIVEFLDLECPACRFYHRQRMPEFRRYLGGVSYSHVIVHLPIPNHEHALPAAIASECAADQGKFKEFIDAAFEKQSQFGQRNWLEYARDAGVTDTARFESCIQDATKSKIVTEAAALAEKLGARGTPSFMINGWLLDGPPSPERFAKLVTDFAAKRNPFASR